MKKNQIIKISNIVSNEEMGKLRNLHINKMNKKSLFGDFFVDFNCR